MGDHMDMDIQLMGATTERDLLMLSQRLMLTMVPMDMDMLLLMLMVTLLLMPMELMEATGDKFMQHSLKKLKANNQNQQSMTLSSQKIIRNYFDGVGICLELNKYKITIAVVTLGELDNGHEEAMYNLLLNFWNPSHVYTLILL